MGRSEEQKFLVRKIGQAVNAFISEFPDTTNMDVIGALEMAKLEYMQYLVETEGEEEDDDEGDEDDEEEDLSEVS